MAKKSTKGSGLSSNSVVLIIVGLAIIIVIYLFVSGSSSQPNLYCGDGICNNGEKCSTCSADCPTTAETYQEQEPYTAQECDNVALSYSRTDFKCYTSQLLQDWINSECTINNLDSTGGTFSVKIGFVIGGSDVVETQSAYLYPQTSHTFTKALKASASSCYCNEISPLPTKQVCRDVTKYQTVTRTRQVCY